MATGGPRLPRKVGIRIFSHLGYHYFITTVCIVCCSGKGELAASELFDAAVNGKRGVRAVKDKVAGYNVTLVSGVILGNHLEKAERLLSEQIKRGYGFSCEITYWQACMECEEKSRNLSREFIAAIPGIRKLLATDVMAAYEGDPAARSIGETIFSYPSIKAMTNYRIAHELHRLGVEIIPRIITEMAHSQTGIDIHPGAVIGERFFIDHGSGTVIGETCEIGNNVRLYQGVTLGAVSFPKDESGRLVKGIPRHPIVEDDVIIYSGTTILGRVRIGKGSVIGGNVWLTSDVPPYTRVTQDKHAQSVVMISGSERE